MDCLVCIVFWHFRNEFWHSNVISPCPSLVSLLMDGEKRGSFSFVSIRYSLISVKQTLFIVQIQLIFSNARSSLSLSLFPAGAYAQLTLLGPAKTNSTTPTSKSTGNESSNGRVLFRTQFSIPERSNSTISTSSLQSVSDTKKARDTYERIVKQLEVRRDFLRRDRHSSLLCCA